MAALYGAAKEAYIVYVGAESTHFVDDHAGSDYSWKVLIDFSPDTEANPNDYTFSSSGNLNEISVIWHKAGLYYLDVIETDGSGCTNRKALVVNVIENNRSITFETQNSSACFSRELNDFSVNFEIFGDDGNPLEETYFPINVSFEVAGIQHLQTVNYDNQSLPVIIDTDDKIPEKDTVILVELLNATDINGQDISVIPQGSTHTRTIYAQPEITFTYFDDPVKAFSYGNYQVDITNGKVPGAVYSWWIDPPNGTSTDLDTIESNVAEIYWDGPIGFYNLYSGVVDGNGCAGDTIGLSVEIQKKVPDTIIVHAGPDTTIGSCHPYIFAGVYPVEGSYTYLWNPVTYLDDPTSSNPVFTPGNTTTYELTVTTEQGISAKDTVTITVSEINADAGDDVLMEKGTTVMLDGSASTGESLSYLWTTVNGVIENGANTAFPLISEPGKYYLEITDIFECNVLDSVEVSRVTYAPIARDVYDTTSYQESVTIPVLENDEDPQDALDPSSLQIVQFPVNGVAEINYFDGSVIYTPNDGFLGGDVFEYRICNLYGKCDNANVYVQVTALEFLIPQAFTPNGDNINDYFEIKGIEMFENNSITIINRWGKKVYEAKKYGIETNPVFWDGKSNQGGGNGDLPTGTYFYVLDLGNGEKPIAGSVYIDR